MNTIEQEIYTAIDNSREDGGFFQIYCKPASEKSYSLLERHCKAFAEFYFINEFNSSKEDCLTTEQLFKLYIEQL